MATAESGGKLLARLGVKPKLVDLFPKLFPGGPEQGSVCEFYGEEGSGKSQTMLHLISRCLLPPTWNGYQIGGQHVGVVLVDNDFHFNILRLAAMMEKQIMDQVEKQTASKVKDEHFVLEVEQLLTDCLRHLHIIQCCSLTNMLITLETVEKLFASGSNNCVLMIDSISAFYNSSDVIENKSYFPRLVKKLESLVQTYRLVVFVSKAALFTKDCYYNDKNASPSNVLHLKHNEYLGKVWSNFVTHRLIFLVCNRSGEKTFYLLKDSGFKSKETIPFQIHEEGVELF